MRTMTVMVCLLLLGLWLGAQEYQIEANVRYSHSPQTVLDVIQPRAPALQERPAVILIQGEVGSADALKMLFVGRGWVVVRVEYRADAAVEDAVKAAQWLARNAAQYKVDPRKIIVCGGKLARLLAVEDAGIAAVVDVDGTAETADAPRKGSAPILVFRQDEPPAKLFAWLKKHKIP
jgi:acetyl esterase/lipase